MTEGIFKATFQFMVKHKPTTFFYYLPKIRYITEAWKEDCYKAELDCRECPIQKWCHFSPLPQKADYWLVEFKEKYIGRFWKFLYKTIFKNKVIKCSLCGDTADFSKYSPYDVDWVKVNGKWQCHQCRKHRKENQ